MIRRRRSGMALWQSAAEAQVAMWTTLGVRVPQLLAGTMTPAERNRMVSEKLAAWADSSQAAAEALGQAVMTPGRTPVAVAQAVMAAAFEPYHKAVTANAKRLGKPRRRRSF